MRWNGVPAESANLRNYTAMLLFCTVGCAQLSTHTPAGSAGGSRAVRWRNLYV